jgi:hypothetical protein
MLTHSAFYFLGIKHPEYAPIITLSEIPKEKHLRETESRDLGVTKRQWALPVTGPVRWMAPRLIPTLSDNTSPFLGITASYRESQSQKCCHNHDDTNVMNRDNYYGTCQSATPQNHRDSRYKG